MNAAFRLESATKEAGVNVLLGEESFDWLSQISKPAPYFRRHAVHLKGYEQPVIAWGTTFTEIEKFVAELPAL